MYACTLLYYNENIKILSYSYPIIFYLNLYFEIQMCEKFNILAPYRVWYPGGVAWGFWFMISTADAQFLHYNCCKKNSEDNYGARV